jgi:hypothetical protein
LALFWDIWPTIFVIFINLETLSPFSSWSWVDIQQCPPLTGFTGRKERSHAGVFFNSYEDNKSLVRNIATASQKYPEEEKYMDIHMADGM